MKHKTFKAIDQQIELLRSERGLIIDDELYAAFCLQNLNYYRLSGYSLTLRKNDKFRKGITFDNIMDIYNFDKELKQIILFYIEDIEIALRTHIAYELGKQDTNPDDAISYTKTENYITCEHCDRFLENLKTEIGNSRDEAFVKHHLRKYNGVIPTWAMVETLSFGKASTLFESLNLDIQKQICSSYYGELRYNIVQNFLESLVVLRNLCAHHARLFNRGIPIKPKFSTWEQTYFIEQKYDSQEIGNKLFFRLPVIMRLSPSSNLTENLISNICELQNKYPFVDLKYYGFKPNWKDILRTLNNKYK